MKKKKFNIYLSISLFSIIFLTLLVSFILKNNKVMSTKINKDYTYGALYTSIDKSKSTIKKYNSEGVYINDKKIEIGGLTLASFLKFGIANTDNIYFPAPILGNKPQNFILEVNKKKLEYKKIEDKNIKTPTFFSIDDNFAYLSVSSLESTILSKTDLKTNTTILSKELKGQGLFSTEKENNLYLASIIHNEKDTPFARIYIIDKSNFNILNTIDIDDVLFLTDLIIHDNFLYIAINRDGSDNLSNKIIKLDLSTNQLSNFIIPFTNINKLYIANDNLLIIQYNYNGGKTDNKIAKINLVTNNIETFSAENEHISTYILDDSFYSSDGKFIYSYDLNSFKLKNKFKLEEPEDQVFVSFFINS